MSRFDAIGLFWQDYAKEKKRNAQGGTRPLAPIPEPNWAPPRDLPNLAAAKTLVIDLETYDPNLKSSGPGDIRGDGHIVGFGVSVPGEARWYLPMRHTLQPELNLDPEQVLAWAKQELTRPGVLKVGANLLYDLYWAQAEGVHIPGPYLDVQWVEAIINETADSMALDALAQRYEVAGKDTGELYEWCAKSYGGKPDGSQRANIYRAPVTLVGPYAESDVTAPWDVWLKQKHIVDQWKVQDLVDLEHRLIPMLLAMRRQGVRVDTQRVEEVSQQLEEQATRAQRFLNETAGAEVNVNAGHSIAKAFTAAGLEYPTTSAGNPSFTKEWLDNHEHPIAEAILSLRKLEKYRGTFVDGYLRNGVIDGRIHSQFHPLRGDEVGAISGRFSSTNPNLQNIPARDKVMAPIIRGLFIPEDGCQWRAMDYSQIEYRMLAHVALGRGAKEMRQTYNDNPDMDYHEQTSELIKSVTAVELGRKPTKNINFGLTYGMGKNKLIRSLGVSQSQGEALFEAYHKGVPFVRDTFNKAADRAKKRGYVRTYMGRIARFDQWEPNDWELRRTVPASKDKEKVMEQVKFYREQAMADGDRVPRPGVVRAYVHKALNRVLQGGAADVIKLAMVAVWEAGCCDVVGPPLLQVHDELDFNDPMTKESAEAFEEITRIMETCCDLAVPLKVDVETGPDWGHLS